MSYILVFWMNHSPERIRSHAGKTKDGQSFKDFLGKKDYDEHMLIPFEKFLNHSFCEFIVFQQ